MQSKGKVLITGATGLIGRELSLALLAKGWKLVILGRRDEASFRKDFTCPCEYFQWVDPTITQPDKRALNVDSVINLMGEPIADQRWTESQKKRLRDSRILSTRNLISALKEHRPNLQSFVSASAIGYYGEGGDQVLTETSPASVDFLGTLCKDWEFEAQKAPGRSVLIRTGIVLASQGGALTKMVPLFENGLGGKLSSGRQWMSWIHIDDLIRIFTEALENPKMQGAFNAVAPTPVTNTEFTKTLAKILRVKAFFPVPKLALKIAVGEMAQVLLASQRLKPEALMAIEFKFKFLTLEEALLDLYGWKESRHDRLFQFIQWVPRPRESVFSFFGNENNLEVLTPEFLNFRVLKKSTENIEVGTEIEYQLKIHGIPAKWKSRITVWNPGHQFKDLQLQGPYQKWDHTHTFEELAGGTLLRDKVVYRLPLANLGGNLASPLVTSDINKIFSFRKNKIAELFG